MLLGQKNQRYLSRSGFGGAQFCGLSSAAKRSHYGSMEFAGVVPHDAPDPRLDREAAQEHLPIPLVELVEQPHVESTEFGIGSTTDPRGASQLVGSVTSTFWRVPGDKADPRNLADRDDATRSSLDEVPPWPRPTWLIEQVDRMRYPRLWEAVRTTWQREDQEAETLEAMLVSHANDVLRNQFRAELNLDIRQKDSPALITESAVQTGIDLLVDGETVSGLQINTDPFVYALGATLSYGGTLTVVLPREPPSSSTAGSRPWAEAGSTRKPASSKAL